MDIIDKVLELSQILSVEGMKNYLAQILGFDEYLDAFNDPLTTADQIGDFLLKVIFQIQ